MYIDEKGIWHCENCGFGGTFDDVKKHKEAVMIAKEYFSKLLVKGSE